jgi:acyl-CoA synthetase (AMP-forming)/AMP-acid ligase II
LSFPDSVAIKTEGRCITYRELDVSANRLAKVLQRHGVEHGTVVLCIMNNSPETLILHLALARLGAVSAFVNPALPGETILRYRVLCGAALLVVDECAFLLSGSRELVQQYTAFLATFIIRGPGSGNVLPERMIDLLQEAAAASGDPPKPVKKIRPSDPLALLFTSGTSGRAKAAIITHGRALMGAKWFGRVALCLTPSDTLYSPLPLFHVLSLVVGWSSVVECGAAMALRDRFSASQFYDDCRKFKATALLYVGEIMTYLSKNTTIDPGAPLHLRVALGNGLRPQIREGTRKKLGIGRIVEIYGASESAWVFANLLDIDDSVGFSLGRFAIVKYDAEAGAPVRAPDGRLQPLPPGETGLLLFKMTKRYGFSGYSDPDESNRKILRNCFRQGDAWFNTGDIMRYLGWRHARFVDRAGDTYRWKGENVSTLEVEDVLESFAQVEAAMVYGVKLPDRDGNAGMAAIVLKNDLKEFDLSGLSKFLIEKLPEYARPLFLRIMKSFPETDTYKKFKRDAQREGFDKAIVKDPMFVLDEKNGEYVPM